MVFIPQRMEGAFVNMISTTYAPPLLLITSKPLTRNSVTLAVLSLFEQNGLITIDEKFINTWYFKFPTTYTKFSRPYIPGRRYTEFNYFCLKIKGGCTKNTSPSCLHKKHDLNTSSLLVILRQM